MNKKRLGYERLVAEIGDTFFNEHRDTACFSYGDTERGLYCFLGIDLHPEKTSFTLSADIDEWDIYASCYVTDTGIIMDKCKLPQNSNLENHVYNNKNLRFYVDETSAPYPEGDNPFIRTSEDDAFDKMIIEKYHLITEEMEMDNK